MPEVGVPLLTRYVLASLLASTHLAKTRDMTHHEFFLVLTSVCEHSDYRLLLGTTRKVPTNHSWIALLRHSKNGVVITVSISELGTSRDAVGDVFRQLGVPETVWRSTLPGSTMSKSDRQGLSQLTRV